MAQAMESFANSVTLAADHLAVGQALEGHLAGLNWPVRHREVLQTRDGRAVAVVFGVTTPFGGSTGFSFFMRGAASVAWLLRIEELAGGGAQVAAWAGGTEGWAGFDYGRNKGVVRRLLDGAL